MCQVRYRQAEPAGRPHKMKWLKRLFSGTDVSKYGASAARRARYHGATQGVTSDTLVATPQVFGVRSA